MRWVCAAGALLLCLSSTARADDKLVEPWDRLAVQVDDAFTSKGREALEALATPENLRTIDPFRVAERLLLRYARAKLADPPRESRAMDAAEAWAAAATKRPVGELLPGLVATWRTLDRIALEDVVRLREAYVAMNTARQRGDWPAVSELVAAVKEAMERSTWSVTVIDLQAAAIVALVRAGKITTAMAQNQDLAERSIKMGWLRSGAVLLLRAGDGLLAAGNPEKAAKLLSRARRFCEQLDRAQDVARVLVTQAQMHRMGGRVPQAAELLSKALALFEAAEDKHGLLRALVGLGNLQVVLGQLEAALASQQRALAIAKELDEPSVVVIAHVNIGVVLANQLEYTAALAHYSKALAISKARRTHSHHALDSLRINMAELYGIQGQYQRALAIYDEVIPSQRGTEAKVHLAHALVGRGFELKRLGRFADALEALEEGLALRRARGQAEGEMRALFGLSGVCMRMGRVDRAIRYGQQALEIAEQLKGDLIVGRALSDLGSIYASAGRNAEAFEYLKKGRERAQTLRNPGLLQLTASNLGCVLSNLGRPEEALPMLMEGVEAARTVGHVVSLIANLRNVAITLTALKRGEEARPYLEEALRVAERVGNRPETAEILRLIGADEYMRGSYAASAATARRAVELRLALERGLGANEVTAVGGYTRFASDYGLEAVTALIKESGATRERLESAFWFAEAGRSIGLLEGIVNRNALLGADLPRALLDAESSMRDDVRIQHERIVREAQQTTPDTDALRTMRAELDKAYERLDEAISRVDRSARQDSRLVDPRPASLSAVQATIPEAAAFLSYQLTPSGQAVVFVITRNTVELLGLGNTERVAQYAGAWRRLLRTPGTDDLPAAIALSKVILKPIHKTLQRYKLLIVAPDGILALLPLDALVRSDKGKRIRLVETHQVVCVPSGSVFAALKPEGRGRGLLALGDPVYPQETGIQAPETLAARGLGRLARIPGTGDEVRAISELFGEEPRTILVREHATREALEEALGGTSQRLRAIHLACHGLVDTERPMLTGLVLAHGRILSVADVHRLVVPADLVVLSACETGLGKLTRSEGVLGLTRGFFFAGASRVVASNWKVSDESTKALMLGFYEGMRKHGMTAAAALRDAKRKQIKAGRSHPYHWASFVLWGLPE